MLSIKEMARIMEEAEYNELGVCTSIEFKLKASLNDEWMKAGKPVWNWALYDYRYDIPMRRRHGNCLKENRLMANIMRSARYDANGTCLNIESLKNLEDNWQIASIFSWDWEHFDYRVRQESKVPEPMGFDDMVDRLTQGKSMYVVLANTGSIFHIDRVIAPESVLLNELMIGSMGLTYSTLAKKYIWFDTKQPCVKPTE